MVTTAKLFEIIGRQYVATLELSESEDAALKKVEEAEKKTEEVRGIWYKIADDKDKEIEQLKNTIDSLEEQLAEKDQMIAGFNHEHARERAEEERDDF